jgi:ketosteroid isomerase-like protein
MTTVQKVTAAAPRHPFAAAISARDHAALVDTLASDVVLHSAVTATPFEGRETVGELYASVIDSFDYVEVTDEFTTGDTHVFFWRGRIDGRFVEGADRLRGDGARKVHEITVVGRPLSGLSTFLSGIGARFARRRRGALVAAILRLTALPLGRMFMLLDPITRWLVRPRARAGR